MIEVKEIKRQRFSVIVSEGHSKTEHTVTLDEDYYQDLTKCLMNKEELIRRSFKFLLKRESKESILSQFDLRIISRYFPEYEKEIKNSKNNEQ